MRFKPLKTGAKNGMRVYEGHQEATKFLKVDIETKLLPRLHEQLCSMRSRSAGSRAITEAGRVRDHAEYGDVGTNGNDTRGKCDGRSTS